MNPVYRQFITIVLSIAFLISFSGLYAENPARTVSLVKIHPEIELEVVEWCDNSQPMIFLAGLGHAAFVFDEFAPLFCDQYRVIGITRRGFGASSVPDDGYDLATLADDIRIVMDSLQVDKAILVGHSLAGDEMTRFAGMFPERVKGLVYLDAAADRVATRDSLKHYPDPESVFPDPTEEDMASVSSFREYYFRANGIKLPESEFLSICNWNPDGSFNGWNTSGSVFKAISEQLEHPDYSKVTAPALAIYGVDYPITELYADFPDQDSLVQKQMLERYEAGKRFDKMSRDQFRKSVPQGEIVEIAKAGHSLYITHIDQVEKAMKAFLKKHEN